MVFDDQECQDLIERIKKSGVLGQTSRLDQLLQYLVDEVRAGRGTRIKAYAIATEVLGRRQDFDPQESSIVRVEVGRLRNALDLYFAQSGRAEKFRIVIPKGSYCPRIVPQIDEMHAGPDVPVPSSTAANWPALNGLSRTAVMLGALALVSLLALFVFMRTGLKDRFSSTGSSQSSGQAMPAANSVGIEFNSAGTEKAELDGFISRFRVQLEPRSRTQALDFYDFHTHREAGKPLPPVQHIVRVTAQMEQSHGSQNVLVSATLSDGSTGKINWGDSLTIRLDASDLALKDAARRIVDTLAPQLLFFTEKEIERRPVESLSAVELFLRSSWFPGYSVNTLSFEKERLTIAEKAVLHFANFGPAHSVIADKLSYLANYVPSFDTPKNRERANWHATRALDLASGDPNVVFNVAVHHWHNGDIEEASRLMRRVVTLRAGDGLSEFMAQAMPLTCQVPTDAAVHALKVLDSTFSPGNPVRWVTLGWIARLLLNQGNAQAALEYGIMANDVFRSPDTLLLTAAISSQAGQGNMARTILARVQEGWPELNVEHYVRKSLPRRCGSSGGIDLAGRYEALIQMARSQ